MLAALLFGIVADVHHPVTQVCRKKLSPSSYRPRHISAAHLQLRRPHLFDNSALWPRHMSAVWCDPDCRTSLPRVCHHLLFLAREARLLPFHDDVCILGFLWCKLGGRKKPEDTSHVTPANIITSLCYYSVVPEIEDATSGLWCDRMRARRLPQLPRKDDNCRNSERRFWGLRSAIVVHTCIPKHVHTPFLKSQHTIPTHSGTSGGERAGGTRQSRLYPSWPQWPINLATTRCWGWIVALVRVA